MHWAETHARGVGWVLAMSPPTGLTPEELIRFIDAAGPAEAGPLLLALFDAVRADLDQMRERVRCDAGEELMQEGVRDGLERARQFVDVECARVALGDAATLECLARLEAKLLEAMDTEPGDRDSSRSVEPSTPDPEVPADPQQPIEAAKEWLRHMLRDGPVPSVKLKRAAEDAGHSWSTVERAANAISVTKGRRSGFGKPGSWSL